MRRAILSVSLLASLGFLYYWNQQSQQGAELPIQPRDEKNLSSSPIVQHSFTEKERIRQYVLGCLATQPGQGFPLSLPWVPLYEIGNRNLFPKEILIRFDLIAFMEMSLAKYKREVKGYSVIFKKRERVMGKLQNPEKIEVYFKDSPHAVYMKWLEGARLAQTVLYVEGENNNYLLARPHGFLISNLVVSRELDGADTKQTGRYGVDRFGFYFGSLLTLDSLKKAKAANTLHLEYQGLVSLPEVENRRCHKFVRKPFDPLEEEGLNEAIVYFDEETGYQVGTVLKNAEGELIGEYFFSNLQINPEFKSNQFQRGAL